MRFPGSNIARLNSPFWQTFTLWGSFIFPCQKNKVSSISSFFPNGMYHNIMYCLPWDCRDSHPHATSQGFPFGCPFLTFILFPLGFSLNGCRLPASFCRPPRPPPPQNQIQRRRTNNGSSNPNEDAPEFSWLFTRELPSPCGCGSKPMIPFWAPILVYTGIGMFTEGTIWLLTHGHVIQKWVTLVN